MRPPKRGNDCERWKEKIQDAAYLLSGDLEIPDPWPIKVKKPYVIPRSYGLCTVWDAIMDRYRASQGRIEGRMRATIAALMLMAGGNRDEIMSGRI